MTRLFHRQLCLTLFVCAQVSLSLRAQPPAVPVPAARVTPPAAPVLHSPLTFFRELLVATPAQRDQRLAQLAAEKRAPLLAKIREYEAMTPAAREDSLAATELHWYLQQFLQKSSTNQADQLARVPEAYREKVLAQLRLWTNLPPPLQKEALAHESTRYFFLLGTRTQPPALPVLNVPPMPPLRQELRRLDNLPPEQRRRVYAHFQNFFELAPAEKQSVLETLPAAQREQVEKTIASLERLPREQRDLGLRSLDQLAGLTAEQRQQFFSSVSRWKQLSAEEQQIWLKLSSHLPPMPPLNPHGPPFPNVSLATNPSR